MDIETFRQNLTTWGLTPQVLVMIGVTSFILLVVSVRVVLKWYLGIQRLQDDLTTIREQLAAIRKDIAKLDMGSVDDSMEKTNVHAAETFRLTH